jgi:hypothetical protein
MVKGNRNAVECLYANYDAEPVVMNFGDSPRLLPITRSILERCGGCTDLGLWRRNCPVGWPEKTVVDEFKRMSRQSYTFFDGKEIFLLR